MSVCSFEFAPPLEAIETRTLWYPSGMSIGSAISIVGPPAHDPSTTRCVPSSSVVSSRHAPE
jgi:hypothetical protein